MSSNATIARLQVVILFVAIVAAGLLYRGLRAFERELVALRAEVDALKGEHAPPAPAVEEQDAAPAATTSATAATDAEIIETIQEILVEEEEVEEGDEDVASWSQEKLKDVLKARGKPVRGTREQLIERVKNVSTSLHDGAPKPEPTGGA
jgi:hypothetical protein